MVEKKEEIRDDRPITQQVEEALGVEKHEPTPPTEVKDKADLAAIRMMEREKAEREKMMTAAAVGTAAGVASTTPAVGERTTRQGVSVDTGTEHPGERVVSPGVPPVRTTPLTQTPATDQASLEHARDESVHQDWDRFPQVNAPRDVGVPTPEGQAARARAEADERRKEGGTVKAIKEDVRSAKEATKEIARDVSEDIDRKI